ncbi:MAG: hypothetical protein EKK55_07090 [Rhodocyclaceae bacterium]|nr:MAG: hypothetical protein EKK55_07090 [Rhodocyclaceae bacterium]
MPTNFTELGLLAKMNATAAARRILDARIAFKLLDEVAADLDTTYQTVLAWEKKLEHTPLVDGVEFLTPPSLPNGVTFKPTATYGEAKALVDEFHEDPDNAGKTPAPSLRHVASLLKRWLRARAADRDRPDFVPAGPKNLEELGQALGVDKFWLSRVGSGKYKKSNPLRLRRLDAFLTAALEAPAAAAAPPAPVAGSSEVHP